MKPLIEGYKAQINKKHRELSSALRKTLDIAIDIGSILKKVKRDLDHGEFLPWIQVNCAFSERTARNYMRVYEYRLDLQKADKTARIADLTAAYKHIDRIEYEKNRKEIDKKMKEVRKKTDGKKYDDKVNKDTYIKVGGVDYTQKQFDEQLKILAAHNERQSKFREKINAGNDYQDTFFDMIDEYILSLKTDNEKLEACNNIIKYCRKLAGEFQRKSIK
jgi:uncharacterized protein (UPF0335 family)